MSGETSTDPFPVFERLSYFHGQLLGARDFRDEQEYFREKIKLLTRCLHGYGVVCGLVVEPEPGAADCEPNDDGQRAELEQKLIDLERRGEEIRERLDAGVGDERTEDELHQELKEIEAEVESIRRRLEARGTDGGDGGDGGDGRSVVYVTPGLGVDCRGNLLVVDQPIRVDLRQALGNGDRRRLERGEVSSLYVSICYCEEPIDPTRPVVTHSCAGSEDCRHARVRESVQIRVTVDPPPADDCCESCCCLCEADCGTGCLLLAEITPIPEGAVAAEAVHDEVRRMLSRHPLTTIVGVNWWQGATYSTDEATDLAVSGLVLKFSGEIRSDSLRLGVVDVIVHQGGRGNVGGIYYVPGHIEVPGTPRTDELVWKSDSDETFQNGDRVIVRFRGDFVLDECCHPVDAENVGGRVPPLPGAPEPAEAAPNQDCISPPSRPGPWTSGDGRPGGVFEGWFYVSRNLGVPR